MANLLVNDIINRYGEFDKHLEGWLDAIIDKGLNRNEINDILIKIPRGVRISAFGMYFGVEIMKDDDEQDDASNWETDDVSTADKNAEDNGDEDTNDGEWVSNKLKQKKAIVITEEEEETASHHPPLSCMKPTPKGFQISGKQFNGRTPTIQSIFKALDDVTSEAWKIAQISGYKSTSRGSKDHTHTYNYDYNRQVMTFAPKSDLIEIDILWCISVGVLIPTFKGDNVEFIANKKLFDHYDYTAGAKELKNPKNLALARGDMDTRAFYSRAGPSGTGIFVWDEGLNNIIVQNSTDWVNGKEVVTNFITKHPEVLPLKPSFNLTSQKWSPVITSSELKALKIQSTKTEIMRLQTLAAAATSKLAALRKSSGGAGGGSRA